MGPSLWMLGCAVAMRECMGTRYQQLNHAVQQSSGRDGQGLSRLASGTSGRSADAHLDAVDAGIDVDGVGAEHGQHAHERVEKPACCSAVLHSIERGQCRSYESSHGAMEQAPNRAARSCRAQPGSQRARPAWLSRPSNSRPAAEPIREAGSTRFRP